MKKLPEPMMRLLKKAKAEYEVEQGKKHDFLKIDGRRVCVLSKNPKSTKPQTIANSMQRLKRALKDMK